MSFPGHSERISACRFSPVVTEGLAGVLTASVYDGTYRLWNNLTGTEQAEFRHSSNYTCSVAFTQSGQRVLSGSFDGSAIVWNYATKKLILKLGVEMDGQEGWKVERIRDRHEDAVVCCEWHPSDEAERAITASLDGTVRVWNTKWGNCVATLKGHSGAVNGCCYSKDGNKMYTASSDGTVREWMSDAPFKCVSIIIGHYGAVHNVAIATSGKHLFSVAEDCTLRAWLKVKLEGPPAPNTPVSRAGSRPFTTGVRASASSETDMEWYQWQQVAIFASPFPLRCVGGSTGEEDEEVACGAANGAVFLLRLMLPGDT
uniref:Guanine nucleotide-binding protein subunit beta-like protein n=1 Tax=Hemiselmis tepida TaxID=464990 RepID=A0A7S0VW73_9CRYP